MTVVRRLAALGLALSLLVVATPPVAAIGSIVVNSKTMLTEDDGTCTLPEAIKAANTDTPSGGSSGECAAGAGADTITFTVSGTIYTTRLPDIASPVTISGGGKVTLDARQGNAFFIVSGSPVHLQGLTFTRGRAQGAGAILVAGGAQLYIEQSTVSSSVAQAVSSLWQTERAKGRSYPDSIMRPCPRPCWHW